MDAFASLTPEELTKIAAQRTSETYLKSANLRAAAELLNEAARRLDQREADNERRYAEFNSEVAAKAAERQRAAKELIQKSRGQINPEDFQGALDAIRQSAQ